MTPEARKAALDRAIQSQIAPTMRVESRSDFQAVLIFGRRPNHILHFLIGLFTIGLWWIVWLALAIGNREQRRLISVDESGRINSQDF